MENKNEKPNHFAGLKEVNIKSGMEKIWEDLQVVKSSAIQAQQYEVCAMLRDVEKKLLH